MRRRLGTARASWGISRSCEVGVGHKDKIRVKVLKEAFQLFWTYKQPWRAQQHLKKWIRSAMRSKLEAFKKFAQILRSHLDGILPWTKTRVSNGAVDGMNKIKSISHRSFGFRTAENFIAAIYHCCARLPLPAER